MKIKKPFKTKFLAEFAIALDSMPFTDADIQKLDDELYEYEKFTLDPDIEKHLISKNEFLASFAISKAEGSSLTIKEAEAVYDLVKSSPELDFIGEKIKKKSKLTVRDYEKLEFYNIAKAFAVLNASTLSIDKLSGKEIKDIHILLTQGMDVFQKHLPKFNVYRSGKWRNTNKVRVGDYLPAHYEQVPAGVNELIRWLRGNFSVTNIGIFHAALYALHPFSNGNKRVCRILEHVLLRSLGLNKKNIFSTSSYYHAERMRYYKQLLYSCNRKNLNHFTAFFQEAVVLSMVEVVKASIIKQREAFVEREVKNTTVRKALLPLSKRKEVRFTGLYKAAKRKMARQTLVNSLKEAVKAGVAVRRVDGQRVYYKLAFDLKEEKLYRKWIAFARERLRSIPDEYEMVI